MERERGKEQIRKIPFFDACSDGPSLFSSSHPLLLLALLPAYFIIQIHSRK